MKTLASFYFVSVLLVCRPCGAYVLGADFLMRLLADARRDAPRAYTLTLNAELAGRDHPVEERLYVKRPERSRLVQMDDTTAVTITREGYSAAGDEHLVKPQGQARNLFAALVYPRGRDLDEAQARLLKTLNGVGIDTQLVSFARNQEQIVYIIGAEPWESAKPQLWLDKNSFLPVLVRLPTGAAAPAATAVPTSGAAAAPGPVAGAEWQRGIAEMRFLEYGAGPLPGVPRIFEEYSDGTLVRRGEVTQGQFNSDLPESLFDLLTAPPRRR